MNELDSVLTRGSSVERDKKIAIAVKYSPGDVAPQVVAKGQGGVADAIIEKGRAHNVVIERNPYLAKLLFNNTKIDDYIPERSYRAVALLLHKINTANHSSSYSRGVSRGVSSGMQSEKEDEKILA